MSPKQFALLIRVIANGFASIVDAIVVAQNRSNTEGRFMEHGEVSTYYYHESEVDEANAEVKQ